MTCHICGGRFEKVVTSLPFKVGTDSIVILKNLPVMQCRNCPECLIEDAVMERIDAILKRVDANTELEILGYPASSLSA
jgi:YgiT-type zinc finger domain-containing protein